MCIRNDILYNSILLLHTAEIPRITNKLQISNKFDFIYNSILVYDDKIAFQKNWLSLLCILMITHFEVSPMQYIKIIRQKQLTILTYLHKTKLIPLHNNKDGGWRMRMSTVRMSSYEWQFWII